MSALLQVQGLSAWHGPAQALFDVSFDVAPGELVVLQGLNGAGKSTLLQALMGLCSRQGGSVSYAGQRLDGLPPHRRAQAGLGYVAEDRRLFASLTVRENLHIAARGDVAAHLARVQALFPVLGQLQARPARQMSGGEQQMLAIARTLMTGPSLLLLDEPCEGIAPVLVAALRDALLALKAAGMPMLVAEQNSILAERADRVLTLAGGRLV